MFKTVFLFLMFSTLTFAYSTQPNWEEIQKKDGITVYKAQIPNSKIVAFKGKVTINASAKKLLWVLSDRQHRHDWVDRLDINQDLEIISPTERVIYQSYKMPLFISNRDMVYKTVLTKNKDSGTYTLAMRSISHEKSPKTIGVRAELINSKYILTPLPGNKTEVIVEILSDPKGLLPAWLINLVQKSWPFKTLKGIRNQVKKEFVKELNIL